MQEMWCQLSYLQQPEFPGLHLLSEQQITPLLGCRERCLHRHRTVWKRLLWRLRRSEQVSEVRSDLSKLHCRWQIRLCLLQERLVLGSHEWQQFDKDLCEVLSRGKNKNKKIKTKHSDSTLAHIRWGIIHSFPIFFVVWIISNSGTILASFSNSLFFLVNSKTYFRIFFFQITLILIQIYISF